MSFWELERACEGKFIVFRGSKLPNPHRFSKKCRLDAPILCVTVCNNTRISAEAGIETGRRIAFPLQICCFWYLYSHRVILSCTLDHSKYTAHVIWCVVTMHHHEDLCTTSFNQLPLEKSCRKHDFYWSKESTQKKSTLLLCSTVCLLATSGEYIASKRLALPNIFYTGALIFRPLYSHLHELWAFVLSGVPMLAATATVTNVIRRHVIQQLHMDGYKIISVSPNKPNIFYSVRKWCTIEDDFSSILDDLSLNAAKAKRVIMYCRSLRPRSLHLGQ